MAVLVNRGSWGERMLVDRREGSSRSSGCMRGRWQRIVVDRTSNTVTMLVHKGWEVGKGMLEGIMLTETNRKMGSERNESSLKGEEGYYVIGFWNKVIRIYAKNK